MITDGQIENLYSVAIEMLETDTEKEDLKTKVDWYDKEAFSNKTKMVNICTFLLENA